MDRDTLSHYGWIVITIIILAIMIGLATPFASSIKASISGSVEQFQHRVEGELDKIYGNIGNTDSNGSSEGSGGGSVEEPGGGGGEGVNAVSTPVVSVDSNILVITNNQSDADSYEIYNGTTLIATIPATGTTTEYDLSGLPAGAYQIGVVGKADGLDDSEKVVTGYIVEDHSGYSPSASLVFKTLAINHDDDADEYVISVNGTKYKTVASLGAGQLSEYMLDIRYGDIISIEGYKDDQKIGAAIEFVASETGLYFTLLTYTQGSYEATTTLNTWDNYYAVSNVVINVYLNGIVNGSVDGTSVGKTTDIDIYDEPSSDGDCLKVELVIDGIVVDEEELWIELTAPKDPGLYYCDTLLADWDTLVNDYGLDVTINYPYDNIDSVESSLLYIKHNNPELFDGDTLVIDDSITKIGENALASSSLTSVVIPDCVTYIGMGAFRGSGVASLNIPTGLTSINDEVFSGCDITGVTIPGGVISIGSSAFENCLSLTSVTIPESVTEIRVNPFSGCYNLERIEVAPGNMMYHSDGNCLIETSTGELISGCKNSVIPNDGSVTSIGSSAFRGCTTLTNITIPEHIANIEGLAFIESGLTSVTIPNGVKSIKIGTFSGCTELTSVTIPDSVTVIDDSAFARCEKLSNVVIPDRVAHIGHSAFSGCVSLTSVTMPDSVTSVETNVFDGCSGLTGVIIGSGITNIEDAMFRGCASLTNVTIPSNVNRIDARAFDGCSGLTSAMFEDPTTWYYTYSSTGTGGGTAVDVTDATEAATYLKTTYVSYYWYKN